MTYDLQAEGINGVTASTSVTANSGFDTGPVWVVDGTQGGTGAIFGTSFSVGVSGQTSGGGGSGVFGVSTLSGNGSGVLGEAGFGGPNVSVGIGVFGRAGVGVYGTDSPRGSPSELPFPVVGDGGVVGDGKSIGVRGRSGPGTGVFGTGVIGVKGGVSLEPTKPSTVQCRAMSASGARASSPLTSSIPATGFWAKG